VSDSSADLSALSPELAQRVDQECDRFEAAWRGGSRPSIKDFLEGWSGPERLALLRHLILVDVECRRGRPDCPPEDYQARFPDLEPAWLARAVEEALAEPGPPSALDDTATPPRQCELRAVAGDEVLEEIGRGGVGVVYRLRDRGLQRDLAIKVLRKEHCDRADLVHRFIEEAQITGQLQHPGVVPVHAIGWLPDGRPFFTMKLIKGRTLAGLLAERSPGANPPGSPPDSPGATPGANAPG